jgi:hypothetical protein
VRLWLSVAAVTVLTWMMKASGPLALGDRQLPPTAAKVSVLMAPVLLAGLIVADLGGAGWSELDWQQIGRTRSPTLLHPAPADARTAWLSSSTSRQEFLLLLLCPADQQPRY